MTIGSCYFELDAYSSDVVYSEAVAFFLPRIAVSNSKNVYTHTADTESFQRLPTFAFRIHSRNIAIPRRVSCSICIRDSRFTLTTRER